MNKGFRIGLMLIVIRWAVVTYLFECVVVGFLVKWGWWVFFLEFAFVKYDVCEVSDGYLWKGLRLQMLWVVILGL